MPAQAQVLLKHKELPETKRTYEVTQLVSQVMTINGQELKTDADVAITISVANGPADLEGVIPQRVKFESLRNNLTVPGGLTLSFDSAVNLAKTDAPQLEFVLDAFKALAKAEYTVTLNKDNEVLSVDGVENILNNATPMAAEVLKAQLNPERIKATHQQELSRVPKKAVKPGDTWQQTDDVDLGSGQTLKVERLYEYLGTEERGGRTLDKISSPEKRILSLEIAPNPMIAIKVTKQDLSVAESKGLLYFDRERGVEVEQNRLLHIKGTLTLSIAGTELPTELDLKIESTQKLKE